MAKIKKAKLSKAFKKGRNPKAVKKAMRGANAQIAKLAGVGKQG